MQQELLVKAKQTIDKNLSRQVKKEIITEDQKNEALGRIATSTTVDSAKDADFAVEAVSENLEIKKKVLTSLDEACQDGVILASNTSSISITEIAAVTKRPEMVIGMHFMNPVPLMKLVEIIRGLATSDGTYKTVQALTEKLGKTPVEVQDYPGFISNRVLMPMINEAIFCLMEGVATKESN